MNIMGVYTKVSNAVSHERRLGRRIPRMLILAAIEMVKDFAPFLILYLDALRIAPWILGLGVWAGVVLASCLLLIGIAAPWVIRLDRDSAFRARWFSLCAAGYAVIRIFAGPLAGPASAGVYAFVLFARSSFQDLGWLERHRVSSDGD